MQGSDRKLARLFHPETGRAVVLPLDHGVAEGMLPGIEEPQRLIELATSLPVQAVMLNKGALRAYLSELPLASLAVAQLSGGTRHCLPPYARSLVCSVAEALRLGADMVAVQVNIANELEDRMLADLGAVVDEAHALGAPVLALISPKGDRVVNEMDPTLINHCIRLGSELGADITGVPYSDDARGFSRALAASTVPVLVTGGPSKADFKSFLAMLEAALAAGAAGTCLGRAILAQPNPRTALRRVVEIVHGPSVAAAFEQAEVDEGDGEGAGEGEGGA
jgi:fructose-bisphosphate aldolase, class I